MIEVYAKEVEDVWLGVAYDDEKVFATNFGSNEKRVLQGLSESLPINARFQQGEKASALADRTITLLKEIYDGKGASNDAPLAMKRLPSYTQRVLKIVSRVPLGYVASYGEIARVAGGSARAVGGVMASNPFAPIVPCHRIVGSDFALRGYAGGLDVKEKFLEREKQGYKSKKEITIDDKRLVIFPAEFALEKARRKSKPLFSSKCNVCTR